MKRLFAFLAVLAAIVSTASAQDWAKARLDKTPRHLEWATVKNGNRDVKLFVGYPEVKEKATVVVLIHDIGGLSDWMRGIVDQFAEAGYIAIAPDFVTGLGPNGGNTDSFGGNDNLSGKIQGLPKDQVNGDLNAAIAYAAKLPAGNGKVVVGGFCWGGGKTFGFVGTGADVKAGLVFYGPTATADEIPKIKAPVYGFYGGNDARITSTVPAAGEAMKAAGKTFDPVTYEGAGHGFMKSGEDPAGSEANKKARADAWKRVKEIMAKI